MNMSSVIKPALLAMAENSLCRKILLKNPSNMARAPFLHMCHITTMHILWQEGGR
jgi:hypothetical protein